ncbi:MAG TPA: MBL fold metallo-hydrolase [Planctomycetaceae bacterium]|nr:MBL fold metallo-hydrolase [Planctomycetaceae bacterium]
MTTLAAGLDYVDLNFLGVPEIIATAILHGTSGVALVDPGPGTTIGTLKRSLQDKGISIPDVRQILLTHIHLDHAGGTGALVRENPHIEVFVHERGAPHMIDPAKLLASAGRLYGTDMERLWGEFVPVPSRNVRVLTGGERIAAAGRELEVAYTPGHASHHVCFFDKSTRVALCGDTAGIRRHGRGYIMPPTPPPDIDLEAWRASAERIVSWDPDTLFLTHFGPFHGARPHFQGLLENLAAWSEIVRRLLLNPSMDDAQRQSAFIDEAVTDIKRTVGEHEAEQYGRAGRLDYSWQGLSRYWRKKFAAGSEDSAPLR